MHSIYASAGTTRRHRIRLLLFGISLLFVVVTLLNWTLLHTFSLVVQSPIRWTLFYSKSIELSRQFDGFDITFEAYPKHQQSASASPSTILLHPNSNRTDSTNALNGLPSNQLAVTWPIKNGPDLVPAILHHIVLGMPGGPKKEWLEARDSCLYWHPDYQYMFWDDAKAEDLVRNDYPEYLEMWRGYRYPIQRADSLRYFVMYKYGGIFLDMDLQCRRSIGPLRKFDIVAPAARPSGVSNGFFLASPGHPFVKRLVENLKPFNKNWFFLPYAAVMISTGCFYMSAIWASQYDQASSLRVLTGPNNLHHLSGNATTPLFHHLGSSSWHSWDARVLNLLSHPEQWWSVIESSSSSSTQKSLPSDTTTLQSAGSPLKWILCAAGLIAAIIVILKWRSQMTSRESYQAEGYMPLAQPTTTPTHPDMAQLELGTPVIIREQ